MMSPTIIEIKILLEPVPSLGNRAVCLQIYILIFHTPPETFYKHIVHPTAFAVHADIYTVAFKNADKCIRGELAALIRIEDFRSSVP